MKGQDILLVLKLVSLGESETPPYFLLSQELLFSPSEVAKAIKRLEASGLIHIESRPGANSKTIIVNKAGLREFLFHGIRYIFPPQRGGEVRGLPTAHGAPFFPSKLRKLPGLPPVWPHPESQHRGFKFEPIFKSVPAVAMRNHKLYEMLAYTDALRGGKARDKTIAQEELKRLLK